MENEIRTVYFDTELSVEAYRFEGIMQNFPNHFHDHYVIGLIEKGQRLMICNNREKIISSGDIIIFNPGDTHACEQPFSVPLSNSSPSCSALYYSSINISPDIMKKAAKDITGRDFMPHFSENVLYQSELGESLQELHLMIMDKSTDFKKEELFLFLLGQLIAEYADTELLKTPPEQLFEIKIVCDYIESNFDKNITLDEIAKLTGFSKYHFLRSFTRQKGISPYSYLETIRIGNAKKLLEKGVPPVEVAALTGFSDQSHFTNFFKKLIGITPKQYMKIFLSDALKSDMEEKPN